MEASQLDSEEWLGIVAALGGDEALRESARAHKAFLRPRVIKSAADLLRVCLGYGPGGHSLRTSAALTAALGIADVSDVAILGRVRQCGPWLKYLCDELLKPEASSAVRVTPRPIRIVDGSLIAGPGDRRWRLHLEYDVARACIIDAAITDTGLGEKLDRLSIEPGEIRLGDRGYAQPDGIKNTLLAGADLIVRVTWNSVRLTRFAGEPLDWLDLCRQASSAGVVDIPVQLHKANGEFKPIELRLVLMRKPSEAAEKAVAKAKRASSKDQHEIDARTVAAAEHMMLLTSLERDKFSTEQIGDLYRLRWQVELAIKRLKSILHIDKLPAKAPDLAQAWLYAHLLFAIIMQQKTADAGALSP